MNKKCTACGAPTDKRKCEYCGSRTLKVEKSESNPDAPFLPNPPPPASPPPHDIPRLTSGQSGGGDSNRYSESGDFSNQLNRSKQTGYKKIILMATIGVVFLVAIGAVLIFSPLFSPNLTAYELWHRSVEAMNEVDSIIDFDAEVVYSTEGISFDTSVTGSQYIQTSAADTRILVEMQERSFDGHANTAMAYRDGYLYFDIAGARSREPMTIEAARDEIADITMINLDITEDSIIDSEVDRSRSGYHLTFDLEIEALTGLMTEFEFATWMLDAEEFTLIVELDRNYNKISSSFDVDVDFRGTGDSMNISMETEVTQIGDVTVEYPSWLDDVANIEFVDPADAPFIGYWGNGIGGIFLLIFHEADSVDFLADGTVIIYEGNFETTESWTLDTEDILRVGRHEFTWEVRGNTLSITDSYNDTWEFSRANGEVSTDRIDNATVTITDSELIGYWDNGSGSITLWVFGRPDSVEFRENGTVTITQDGRSRTIDWDPDSSGAFTAEGREFTYQIRGDRLTIIDCANDDWTFDYAGEATSNIRSEPAAITDSELIGNWDNGSGRIFLFVFDRADEVEFLENGTVIITQDGTSRTVDWSPGSSGAFTAEGREFTYRVRGNTLTITDSAGDDWTFERADEARSNTDNEPASTVDSELIGNWENGSGAIALFVFRRADEVEFLENGTVIITQDGTSRTVDWSVEESGAFTAGGSSFTYRVRGDTLTITDSANDDWTFERAR